MVQVAEMATVVATVVVEAATSATQVEAQLVTDLATSMVATGGMVTETWAEVLRESKVDAAKALKEWVLQEEASEAVEKVTTQPTHTTAPPKLVPGIDQLPCHLLSISSRLDACWPPQQVRRWREVATFAFWA